MICWSSIGKRSLIKEVLEKPSWHGRLAHETRAKMPVPHLETRADARATSTLQERAMAIFDDNSLTIGNTPLVRLNRLARGLGATVAVKIEGATRPIRSVPHGGVDGLGSGT